jgi:lipopolysaccharide transport system permease protein
VAWSFFSSSLNQSTVSLLTNRNLLTKVYFPRLVFPIASLGRGAVDFAISFVLLILLSIWYGIFPSARILLFPLFVAMGLFITLGIGLFFSALSARYHDLRYGISFLIQMWFWVTPVAYGLENIPEKYEVFFLLNPMTWIIQGFRWSMLGVGEMDPLKLVVSALLSITILFGGLYYFRRMEHEFADVI